MLFFKFSLLNKSTLILTSSFPNEVVLLSVAVYILHNPFCSCTVNLTFSCLFLVWQIFYRISCVFISCYAWYWYVTSDNRRLLVYILIRIQYEKELMENHKMDTTDPRASRNGDIPRTNKGAIFYIILRKKEILFRDLSSPLGLKLCSVLDLWNDLYTCLVSSRFYYLQVRSLFAKNNKTM